MRNCDAEVLVLLSGGIDSTACVDFYLQIGRPTCALFINYGQLAAKQEEEAAIKVTRHYSISLLTARWISGLDKTTGYIPGRNAFLINAALMERPQNVSTIVIGTHAGTNYADSSSHFNDAMQALVDVYEKGKVRVTAPFIDFNKTEIISYCKKNDVPIHLTYSCEFGTEAPCGKCLSCQDREGLLNACS